MAGGATSETLDILIASAVLRTPPKESFFPEPLPPKPTQWSAAATVFVPKPTLKKNTLQPTTNDRAPQRNWRSQEPIFTPPSLSQDETPTIENDVSICEDGLYDNTEEDVQFDLVNHEDRSVTLRGLPAQTTLSDIAKAVRGGLVLNMFIRRRERTAHVNFVDPFAAEKFLMHSRRNDLYIRSKRVCILSFLEAEANDDCSIGRRVLG